MDEIKCAKCGEEKNIHKEEIFNKYIYCTCNKCKHKTEFLETSGSKNEHVCLKHGSSDMRKLFSGFSVGQGSQDSGSCPTGTCPTGTCGL